MPARAIHKMMAKIQNVTDWALPITSSPKASDQPRLPRSRTAAAVFTPSAAPMRTNAASNRYSSAITSDTLQFRQMRIGALHAKTPRETLRSGHARSSS